VIAFLVVGVVLILVATVDGVLTTVHPTRRGPVSSVAARGAWVVSHAAARAAGRPGLVGAAGPLAVLSVFTTWIVLFWLGYALVYLAYVDSLSYSPSGSYGTRNFWDALYLSGMSLTTVGFGDVVGGTDTLRLVTVAEAATGFGVITAAITYLLSVYPLVSNLRGAARMVHSQAEDPARAAQMVVEGGSSYLSSIQQQLVLIDESRERFPLLYYFRGKDPEASVSTLLRGGVTLCLQARWGIAEEAASFVRVHGDELARVLQGIIERHRRRFMFGRPDPALERSLTIDDARGRFERLVRAAGAVGRRAPPDERELREFAAFVGRADAYLAYLAEQDFRPYTPILADSQRPAMEASARASEPGPGSSRGARKG
jgi:hypothetical protein